MKPKNLTVRNKIVVFCILYDPQPILTKNLLLCKLKVNAGEHFNRIRTEYSLILSLIFFSAQLHRWALSDISSPSTPNWHGLIVTLMLFKLNHHRLHIYNLYKWLKQGSDGFSCSFIIVCEKVFQSSSFIISNCSLTVNNVLCECFVTVTVLWRLKLNGNLCN